MFTHYLFYGGMFAYLFFIQYQENGKMNKQSILYYSLSISNLMFGLILDIMGFSTSWVLFLSSILFIKGFLTHLDDVLN